MDIRIANSTKQEWNAVNDRYFAGELIASDLHDWREHRLRSVVDYVRRRSPFYRRLLEDTPTPVSRRDLVELPTTTKADLRAAMHDVLCGPMSDAAVYYETTGTTGASTPCPRGPLDVWTSNAHVADSWRRLFRAEFGDRMPVIGLMGPSELYAFGDTFSDVAQELGAAHVKIWPESPRVGFAKALQLMRDLGVEVVVCAPALCLNLAKAALHNGYDPREDFAVRQFLTLGEICTPAFRENVRSVWGASVTPTLYGSQEALAIATGCTEGRLHLSETNYIAELLDDDGHPVEAGRAGELCLTMLGEGIKPLIRYRTGDQVAMSESTDCGCEHPGSVVDVRGRVDDRVRIGHAALDPAQLETEILTGVSGCLGYQVVITETGDLDIALELVPGRHHAVRALAKTIEERLREATGVRVAVHVADELDPIVNTGAYVSWKAARIVDRRRPLNPLERVARTVSEGHLVTT